MTHHHTSVAEQLDAIIAAICAASGVSRDELTGHKRTEQMHRLRCIYGALASQTSASVAEICHTMCRTDSSKILDGWVNGYVQRERDRGFQLIDQQVRRLLAAPIPQIEITQSEFDSAVAKVSGASRIDRVTRAQILMEINKVLQSKAGSAA